MIYGISYRGVIDSLYDNKGERDFMYDKYIKVHIKYCCNKICLRKYIDIVHLLDKEGVKP